MFDKYLNSILQDKQTKMYVAVAVIIYITCFTNMIPPEMKKIIKTPLFKVSALAGIAYLSTKNFEGALMMTIIYFAVMSCSNNKEDFTVYSLIDKVDSTGAPVLDSNGVVIKEYKHFLGTGDGIDDKSAGTLEDAIKNSGDTSLKGDSAPYWDGDNKLYIQNIGLKADDTANTSRDSTGNAYDGICSTTLADDATGYAVSGYCAAQALLGNPCEDEGVNPTTSKCGPILTEISACAMNDNGVYGGNDLLSACASAYGKKVVVDPTKCAFVNDEGECLDEDDGDVVSGCANPEVASCTAPKGEMADSILGNSGSTMNSITLASVKGSYLKNIKDTTRYVFKTGSTTEYEYEEKPGPIHKKNADNRYLYQIIESTDTAGDTTVNPPSQNSSAFSKIPKRKFNTSDTSVSYLYTYTWNDPDADRDDISEKKESAIDINIKKLDINGDEVWTKKYMSYGETPDVEYNGVKYDEITPTEMDQIFIVKAGVSPKDYELELKIHETDTSCQTTAASATTYVDATGAVTCDANLAVVVNHPAFDNKIYELQPKVVTEDLYNLLRPYAVAPPTNGPGGYPDDAALEAYSNNVKQYGEDKQTWENRTAKKIMRTIGCHRLRDPVTQQYGWWDSATSKCLYEAKTTSGSA